MSAATTSVENTSADLAVQGEQLNSLLKLRNNPFGMKMFERAEDMEAIPRIRRPKNVHTLDQVVAQADSLWEDFILRNRRILADQMGFLMTHLPKSSRLMS